MNMKITTAAILSGAALMTVGAQAGTIVQAPNKTWERSHAQILSQIYGETFGPAASNADSYSNADNSIVVTRVDDEDDQSYDFRTWSAEVLATFAGAGQAFGTEADGQLFAVEGGKYDVTGSVSDVAGGEGIKFKRFIFAEELGTYDLTTDPADNPDGVDFAVTYTVTIDGQLQENTYLIWFEDSNEYSDFTDWDYNDLVVKVTGTPIPEPSALALMGMGGLAMLRRRR